MKRFKPYAPGRRFMTVESFDDITATKPYKKLTFGMKKTGGRNNTGRISQLHRGGGHKRKYRIIDFKRDKYGVKGVVKTIEYDPNRSARISLIEYEDGEKRYIIFPDGLKVGDEVISGEKVEAKTGNAMKLKNIPVGSFIHNIELVPGRGGVIARSAGSYAQLLGFDPARPDYAIIKMPSGERRLINKECMATIGRVGNIEHENIVIGKAGRMRWLGMRPKVRGVKMNAVDHPHGGGRGRSKGGNHPRSYSNVPAKGYKTRDKKKTTSWMILVDRRVKAAVQL